MLRIDWCFTVLNYLCDFFSCKHLFFLREDTSPGINSLYALHRSLTVRGDFGAKAPRKPMIISE